jgi:hypothetical protein
MENNIELIQEELEEARQSLHETVAEVNRKVETVGTQLKPGHMVERHPLLSVCIAGAMGFAMGDRTNGPIAVLVVGGLLGAMLSEVWNDGSCNHGTTTASA